MMSGKNKSSFSILKNKRIMMFIAFAGSLLSSVIASALIYYYSENQNYTSFASNLFWIFINTSLLTFSISYFVKKSLSIYINKMSKSYLDSDFEIDSVIKSDNELDKLTQIIEQISSEQSQLDTNLSLILDSSNDGLWSYNTNTKQIFFSPRLLSLLGIDEITNINQWVECVTLEQKDEFKKLLNSIICKEIDTFEKVFRFSNGHTNSYNGNILAVVKAIATTNKSTNEYVIGGSLSDITNIRDLEEAIDEAQKTSLQALKSVSDGVVITDPNGLIKYMNPKAEKLIGWKIEEVKDTPSREVIQLVTELTRKPDKSPIDKVLEKKLTTGNAKYILVSKNGSDLDIEASAQPILDNDKNVSSITMVFRDVSGTKQLARQISYQSSHDELTGLINRKEFERLLKVSAVNASKDEKCHSMLYIDIDLFKVINDTCGHIAGDQLLREIAPTMQKYTPDNGVIARLGGDEFGVLLENCSESKAKEIALQIKLEVEKQGFYWHGQSFVVSLSIGIVSIDANTTDVSDILRRADTACFSAKDSGRSRIHSYCEDDADITARHGQMQWVSKLNEALENDKFILYYQTIAPLIEGKESGKHYEILLRLEDENGKLVPPFIFLGAAERYNMITKIDRWVVKNTLSWLSKNTKHLSELSLCSINLSGSSLSDPSLLDYIIEQFKKYSIPYEKICFEVTETMAVANMKVAEDMIISLRKYGCKFALDDFGTGMASFEYLKNMPVDFLKIDGSFVKDMTSDPIDSAMVKSINDIGHVMGKQTIAEFVENDDIGNMLRDIGVDFAQGYGIAIPTPLNTMSEN